MTSTNKPLDILYRDEWLVAVDKPAGHLVHPADEPKDDDLVTMKILRDQLGRRVYNIHRLDRPTTGVLLFGIDRDAAKDLHRALERHEISKTYLAICEGCPAAEEWVCNEPIQKEQKLPQRDAHTSFRRLAISTPATKAGIELEAISLIAASPHTGRYHQIRRHLLHHELPIIGDFRYAGIERSSQLGELLGTGSRMLLQSKSLDFIHPVTGRQTHICAPPDPFFVQLFPKLFGSE
jgi:tRNA pseudouridine65 synthase